MAETIVQVNSGTGPKLHGWDRTVTPNVVIDQFVLPGEYPLAGYTVASTVAVSTATAASHLLQIMAGPSLNVRIRSIRIEQAGLITAAAIFLASFVRLTSAGSGGSALTPSKLDNSDLAAGATAMQAPTANGTEGAVLATRTLWPIQTASTAGAPGGIWTEWRQDANNKPIIIPAGAANGLAIKNVNARAGLTVYVSVEFVETSY